MKTFVGGAIQTAARGERDASQQAATPRSLLMVDCGSVYTKAALLGVVEGRFRLLALAQEATTLAPPVANVALGLRNAIAGLERVTGRTLLREGRLITPEQDDGAGVDSMALATSVGGPLRLLAIGPGREALAGLTYRALGGLFVELTALPPINPQTPPDDPEWRQLLAQARALDPDALLVVGAPFGALRAQSPIADAATAVVRWLDGLREPSGGASGERRLTPVVVTGSTEDAEVMRQATQGRVASFQAIATLTPATLAPLNRAIGSLYETGVLRDVPGYAGLRAQTSLAPNAATSSLAGVTRYLAQHFQTTVVTVDVGASSTTLAGVTAQGEFFPAAHPTAGVGPGLGYLLRAVPAANVLRWLEESASEEELREYALMRMLRPRTLPMTPRELAFEQAFAREAIALALRAPGSQLANLNAMDVVLGTGGVLANAPHPGQAALILLDALQPRGVSALVLDTAHLANALGSVAAIDPTAAAEVAESDAVLLQLGTVISPMGSVAAGEPVLRAELEYADGRRHVEDVTAGQLKRLPLASGERARLSLYPAPTVDAGLGLGKHARASDAIEGGALGLLVDTRGRPFAPPTQPEQRIAALQQWRAALGL